MLKETVPKLYDFISKLLLMLEDELNELKSSKSKSAMTVKKNITDMLHKLVTLIIQLNKISNEELCQLEKIMPKEDQKIIEHFLNKYTQNLAKKD
jgi:hypothetical protein